MWSAMFSAVAPSPGSRKLLVMTTSGRCRRTDAVMACRRGTPYSSTPSGRRRKSISLTPTMRQDSTCSAPRGGRAQAPPQRPAVLDHAIGQAQEVDLADADDAAGLHLLGLTERS